MGGGTFNDVRAHLSLCTRAFGGTARYMYDYMSYFREHCNPELVLTKMADHHSGLITNLDVEIYVNTLLTDPGVSALIFNVALCDFTGEIDEVPSGKTAPRLQSRDGPHTMVLTPSKKIISNIKLRRPDIFVIGFKTTSNDDATTQIAKARRQISESGADIVVANDIGTRQNILVRDYYAPMSHENTFAGTREEVLNKACDELIDHVKV
jgi:phosphopantothenoylcysteine synthetase/decarboxylase